MVFILFLVLLNCKAFGFGLKDSFHLKILQRTNPQQACRLQHAHCRRVWQASSKDSMTDVGSRAGIAKFTDSWVYGTMEATAVFFLLSAIDGAFSGDWVRYGLIDSAFENQLKTFVTIAGILHIGCGAVGGLRAAQKQQPVLPAILHSVLVGFLGVVKVYFQTDANPVRWPTVNGLKQRLTSLFAGTYDARAVNEKIDQDLQAPLVMYSFTTCPYCLKAKAILQDKYQIDLKVIELDVDRAQGNAIRLELSKRTGRTSVPSIWLNGQFLGGCNDGPTEIMSKYGGVVRTKGGIASLDREGTLKSLLDEIGS
eukprot:gene32320-39087_t